MSSRVVVSPSSGLPEAMSRSRRRMILPLRVLGKASVNRIMSGRAMAPISLTTCSRRTPSISSERFHASGQGDETGDSLPLELMGNAHHSRLRHVGMGDHGALHLHGSQPVAGNVDDVVHAAHDPEVAVPIPAGPVPVK